MDTYENQNNLQPDAAQEQPTPVPQSEPQQEAQQPQQPPVQPRQSARQNTRPAEGTQISMLPHAANMHNIKKRR